MLLILAHCLRGIARQINRGGEKISPLEVDAALLSLDGVGEAVAFGVPDEKYGEKASARPHQSSQKNLGSPPLD